MALRSVFQPLMEQHILKGGANGTDVTPLKGVADEDTYM